MNFYQQLIQRIEQREMDAHDYNSRGNCHLRIEDYSAALRDLTIATEMDPMVLFYWTDRANLFMRLRRYEHAIVDCRLAITFQKLAWLKKGKLQSPFYPFSVAVDIINQARTLLGYNLLPPPRQKVSYASQDLDVFLLEVFAEQRSMVLV